MLRALERCGDQPFTYREVGDTRSQRAAPGFAVAHYRVKLGEGIELFHLACQAISDWRMVPPYLQRAPQHPLVEEDQCVVQRMWAWGLWVRMACRVVYTIDEVYPSGALRFGFAYGTLPDHIERGEERFVVEWLPDDAVWYDLYAFSRPQSPLAWLGMPIARWYQRRFAIDSCRQMLAAVRDAAAIAPANGDCG
jgi:uncharacterized protein (UPF0548 family)